MKQLIIIFCICVTHGQGIESHEPSSNLIAKAHLLHSVDKNIKSIGDDEMSNEFSDHIIKSKSTTSSTFYRYKKLAETAERIKSDVIEKIRESLQFKPSSTFIDNQKEDFLDTTVQFVTESSFDYVTTFTRRSRKPKKDEIESIKKSLQMTTKNSASLVRNTNKYTLYPLQPRINSLTFSTLKYREQSEKFEYQQGKVKNMFNGNKNKQTDIDELKKALGIKKKVKNRGKKRVQNKNPVDMDIDDYIVENNRQTDIEELKKALGFIKPVKNKSIENVQELSNSTSYHMQNEISTSIKSKEEYTLLKNNNDILSSNNTAEELSALKNSLGYFARNSTFSTPLFFSNASMSSNQNSKENSSMFVDSDSNKEKLSKILVERRFESQPRKLINNDSNKKQIEIILKSWELGSLNDTQVLNSYNESQLKEILKLSPGLRKLKKFREAKKIENIKDVLGYKGLNHTQSRNNNTNAVQMSVKNITMNPKVANETRLFRKNMNRKEIEEIKQSLTLFGRKINNRIEQKLDSDDQRKSKFHHKSTPNILSELEEIKTTGLSSETDICQNDALCEVKRNRAFKIFGSLSHSSKNYYGADKIAEIKKSLSFPKTKAYDIGAVTFDATTFDATTTKFLITTSQNVYENTERAETEQHFELRTFNDYKFYEVGQPLLYPQYKITTESNENFETSQTYSNFQKGSEITYKKDKDNDQQNLDSRSTSNTNQKSQVVSIKYYKPIQIYNNPVYILKKNDLENTRRRMDTEPQTKIKMDTESKQQSQNIDPPENHKTMGINKVIVTQTEQSTSESTPKLHIHNITTEPTRRKNETPDKKTENLIYNVSNLFISEFSSLINNYVKDQVSKVEADQTILSLIHKINNFRKNILSESSSTFDYDRLQKNKNQLDTNKIKLSTNFNEKEDNALKNLISSTNENGSSKSNNHEKEWRGIREENHPKLLNDALKGLRNLIENEDRTLMHYDWLGSTISIHIGLHKIKKLCNGTGVSDEKKLMMFIKKIFKTSVDLLPEEIYEQRLDKVCSFFQDILKHLRPLHLAMDRVSSKRIVNNEQMFKGLMKHFLAKFTAKTLSTVILHVATNRILHEIDSKFEAAYLSNNLQVILAEELREYGNTTEKSKTKIVQNKSGNKKNGKKKKKPDEEEETIQVEKKYADLIEDFMLIYTILFELS